MLHTKTLSIYNNRIVNLPRAWLTWTDGRSRVKRKARAVAGERRPAAGGGRKCGRRRRGRQAKIAMSRQGRGLRGGRAGEHVQAIPPQSGMTACIHKRSTTSVLTRFDREQLCRCNQNCYHQARPLLHSIAYENIITTKNLTSK